MTAFEFLKLSALNFLIRLLEGFVRKNHSLWVIGMDDGGGVRLSGNAWYFLNYLRQAESDLRVVCVTSHPYVEKELQALGVEWVRPNTWRALVLALRAGVYFICGELHDEVPNFSKKNSLKIHLWHGVPLKKIFYGSPKMMERFSHRSFKMRLLEKIRGQVKLEEYDAIIYTSENFKKIMSEAFRNPNVYLTGQPRDDVFYKPHSRDQILDELGLSDYKDHRLVCYLPTFRDTLDKKDNCRIFKNNLEAMALLKSEKVMVFQKDHNSILESRERDGQVLHLTNEVETQKLLLVADLLITDYSSVYIDYLHLLRPILFYCYDLESYTSKDRELYFEYFEDLITPGPKVRSEAELLREMLNHLSRPNLFEKERKRSLDFFQFFQDGQNSRRVVELTKKLIQKTVP